MASGLQRGSWLNRLLSWTARSLGPLNLLNRRLALRSLDLGLAGDRCWSLATLGCPPLALLCILLGLALSFGLG